MIGPASSPSGSTRSCSQRLYAEDDVERVRLLQRLYAAGLSSRTIAELLPCVDVPDSKTPADAAWERMLQERDRIDQHIAELVRTRDALDRMIEINCAHREILTPAGANSPGRP